MKKKNLIIVVLVIIICYLILPAGDSRQAEKEEFSENEIIDFITKKYPDTVQIKNLECKQDSSGDRWTAYIVLENAKGKFLYELCISTDRYIQIENVDCILKYDSPFSVNEVENLILYKHKDARILNIYKRSDNWMVELIDGGEHFKVMIEDGSDTLTYLD